MKIKMRYFAALRERLGCSEEVVELDASATVADLWETLIALHPELGAMRAFVRVAVNHDFADEEAPLAPDDEVALIPPVSGGASANQPEPTELVGRSGAFRITDEVLDADAVRAQVARAQAGAIVLFEGVVRDHTGDHEVSYLEYETYLAMALQKLEETADEVVHDWPQAQIAIHHRYGTLQIGEVAVVIAVSSPHRAEAFEACQYAIDRLKQVVPIWKKEVGPDGQEWVGFGP